MKKNFSKLLALYLPYFLLGLAATNFGEAWRLAEGKEMGDRIAHENIDVRHKTRRSSRISLHKTDSARPLKR